MPGAISATISHKFEVSQFENPDEDGELCSPDLEVVHNGVTLKFSLRLYPKDPENKDHIGLYVFYEDGPQAKIKMHYDFFVINGKKRITVDESSKDQEFEADGEGWGVDHIFSRSVNELKTAGYLSSRGKILHVGVKLSIPDSAFVLPLQIFASITHKFDVEEILNALPGDSVDGSVIKVVHNNVKLDFKLSSIPNDTDESTGNNRIGFYVEYLKGPNTDIVMDFDIIVAKGRKRHSILHFAAQTFTLDDGGFGDAVLPRTIDELRAAGYLSWDNNKLYVIAELGIHQSAFAVPEAKPALVHVQVDTVGFHLYQELTSPVDTTFPASNRVELVSNDDTHLWAHGFRNNYDVLKSDGFINELMNGNIENGHDVVVFLLDSVVTLPSH